MREIFNNPFIVTLSTYIPMLFQMWFPIAIFSRFKITWILIGVCFHLGVATFMGLITFSTVMMS
jgi:hypothetical protein